MKKIEVDIERDLDTPGFSLKKHLDFLEREYLKEAFLKAGGNKAWAATLVGYLRTTYIESLKRLGMKRYFNPAPVRKEH